MILKTVIGCAALAGICFSCSSKPPVNIGISNGKLSPCPDSPNCVSSFATDTLHATESLAYDGDKNRAREKLLGVITSMKRTKIIASSDEYIHAEFTSAIFHFVDDVEFLLDDSKKVIQVRSASRVGYGDMGVNRKRVDAIRKAFNK